MVQQTFLRLPQVEQATGLRRSSIYRLIQQGLFPEPVLLGPHAHARATAWVSTEIDGWIQQRIAHGREERRAKVQCLPSVRSAQPCKPHGKCGGGGAK